MALSKAEQIINFGVQNKKSRDEIMAAILKSGSASVVDATPMLASLDQAGTFNYAKPTDIVIENEQQFNEQLKFAQENKASADPIVKEQANQFLLDVESKAILPTGKRVTNESVRAILQNPETYHDLTAGEKGKLLPELSQAGFKFPRKMTGEQKKAQVNAESAIGSIQTIRDEIFEAGELREGQLIQEALPFALGARVLRTAKNDAKDVITRLRTGAALTSAEERFYGEMIPGVGDNKEDAQFKLDNLEVFYKGISGEPITLKNDQGHVVEYDDMFDPAQRREVRQAMKNGYRPFAGNEFEVTVGKTISGEKPPSTFGEGDPAETGELGAPAIPTTQVGIEETTEEEIPDKKGFLTRAGEAVGGFLGGKRIGEAAGETVGSLFARFGKAGETFKNTIAKIEQDFQDGRIDQAQRDKLLEQQEKNARDAFGYEGPSAKQIAGDVLKIGTTFIGGGAAKGAAGVAKLAGIGAAAGVGEALADEEEVTPAAITGATIGGALGVFGKVAGKAAGVVSRKIDDFADLGGKAEKLATEILSPTKKELADKLAKTGDTIDAVKLFSKNVRRAENFGELRAHNRAITEALFDERNKIISENNFDITDYLKPLKNKITELEKSKLATPAQISKMKDILNRETEWITEQGGKISRLDAQARKEAIQDVTQPLLKKKAAGTLAQDEANDKIALDAIRGGLKEAIEGGDERLIDINSQYSGLKRITELISGREALALKASEQSILQKIAAPIVDIVSSMSGSGSAAFIARQAAKQEDKLIKLTAKLEKLSKDKGGVFTELMSVVKRIKDGIANKEQGFIGDKLDDLDEFVSKKRVPGLSIKETPDALREAIKSTEDSIRALKGRGLKESSPQVKKLIGQLDELRKQ